MPVSDDVRGIDRRRWPAHVTLVSNFVTAASVDELTGAVRRACTLESPMSMEFEGLDRFGPNRDVLVRLVKAGRVTELHRHVVDELESLTDVVPDEPAYRREGYRPHLTLGSSIEVAAGERWTVDEIAIARLDRGIATVVAAFGGRSAPQSTAPVPERIPDA